VLPLALTTGHMVGLGVVGAAFVVFALVSAILIPRFRVQYPGRGLPAFIVVAFVFFVGMLTAVSVFGAEPKETKKSRHAAQTFTQAQVTTSGTATTLTTAPSTTVPTTTHATTTTKAKPKPAPPPQTIHVTETEFKIVLATTSLKTGPVIFDVKNAGKLVHDLAIVGGPKTVHIGPGKTATLKTTLKSGTVELYCSIDSHKQFGMDLKVKVS
jgi:uncharacterized cupredoxin-like copper-binding protein